MNLLSQFVEKKTKFNLTENQSKSLDLISAGRSLEEIHLLNKESGSDVQYWQLDLFETLVQSFNALEKKKLKFISDVEHQNIENKSEVVEQLKNAFDDHQLEDLYRPYKRRKKTKATLAREAGLAELADWILDIAYGKAESSESLEVKAKQYIKPVLGFVTYDIVLKGAQDIIVDRLLKKAEVRQQLSDLYYTKAILRVEKTDKFKNTKYTSLLNFKEKVSSLLESKNYYKFPLVKKAWEEGQLKVLLEVDKSELVEKLKSEILKLPKENPWAGFVNEAFLKAVDIHVIPSITQEIIEELLIVSENETIKRLKQDYQKILMTPAFGDRPVLSFTQTKESQIEMALVTDLGELVSATSVELKKETSKSDFLSLIEGITKQIKLGAMAIGLSPFSRNIEAFIRDCFDQDLSKLPAPIAFVDTRGASSFVHNCHELDKSKTRLEYTLLTIARRMQDPLMELAKYNAKSLLDIPSYVTDEKLLPELDKVLRFCMASVGLDLNKATKAHLVLIPGLTPEMQDKILEYRNQKARFVEKSQLRTELNMLEEEFDLSSSFLKVSISKSLLDRTQLSGKDFPAIKDFLKDQNLTLPLALTSEQESEILSSKWNSIFGEKKLKFILKELKNPYVDPRRTYKFFGFSDKLMNLEDIKVGWNYPALVTKFSSFGVFVDLGVQQEGLIHLSELSNEYVSDPRKVVGIGEWIYVNVIDFNIDKKLISLSKIKAEKGSSTQVKSGSRKQSRDKKPSEGFKKTFKKNSEPAKSAIEQVASSEVSSESKDRKFSQRNNVRTYDGGKSAKDGKKPFNKGSRDADGSQKPRPQHNKGGGFKGKQSQKVSESTKSKSPFNNPFAALSNLNLKE